MFKIAGALVLGFPIIFTNARWFLALWGIDSMALALVLALWFAIGAFTDVRRAYVALNRN